MSAQDVLVDRIELRRGHYFKVEQFGPLAHPYVTLCGPNDEELLAGEVVNPRDLALDLMFPAFTSAHPPFDVEGEIARLVRDEFPNTAPLSPKWLTILGGVIAGWMFFLLVAVAHLIHHTHF